MTPVQITKQDLEQKVQAGWKKTQLAEHYGLPEAQVGKLLKEAGLTIRKFHNPKYVLIDEEQVETEVQAEVQQEVAENTVVNEAQNVTEEVSERPQGW